MTSTPLASNFKRGLATGLATGVLLAVVTLCITVATGNNPSISTLVVVTVIAVLALGLVGLLPPTISLLYLVDDILMLLRIDIGQLSSDPQWHPDLTISHLQLPGVVEEAGEGYDVRVGLQYKELLAQSSHIVTGTAELTLDPPLLRIKAQPFTLSSSRVSPGPLAHLNFQLPADPFDARQLYHSFDFKALESHTVECNLRLTIRPDWPIRISPEAKRAITIDLGVIHLRPIGIKSWFSRMVQNEYITLLPNNLTFNPVVIAPNHADTGTNIVIASKRWLDEFVSVDREAALLLQVASRMLAEGLALLPEPSRYVNLTNESALLDEACGPEESPSNLFKMLNVEDLISPLRNEAVSLAAKLRSDLILDTEQSRLRDAYPAARRPCRFLIQDMATAASDNDNASYNTVALIAFEDLPRTRCVLTLGPTEEPFEREQAVPLASVMSSELATVLSIRSGLEEASQGISIVNRGPSVEDPVSTPEPQAPASSQQSVNPPELADGSRQPSVDRIESRLERLAALINSSMAIMHGVYVQPDSSLDNYWIDLDLASDIIEARGLSDALYEVLEDLMLLLGRFHRRNTERLVNCCAPDTSLADFRFRPLVGWRSQDCNISTQSAIYSNGHWNLNEWGGDSVIISALSNNWSAFDALMRNLSGKLDIVTFVPVFGAIASRRLDNFESGHSAPGMTLPLLVWDISANGFIPGPASRRFTHVWAGLRRAANS
jgi:hypothetical protein